MHRVLRVAVPPGIGDIYWSALKLQAILDAHPGDELHLVVLKNPLPRFEEFLRMLPTVTSFSEEEYVPWRFVGPSGEIVYPAHRSPRLPGPEWRVQGMPGPEWKVEYVPSGRDIAGFDYFLWANEHLEEGHRIEEWLPELAIDWGMTIRVPQDEAFAAGQLISALGGEKFLCIYTSAIWGNLEGMQEGQWCAHHWMEIVDTMWERFHMPTILLGAHWDRDFANMLARWNCRHLYDLVGQTTLGETLTLLLLAAGFVGYPSGLTTLSTHLKTPTVMLWPDSSKPTRYGVWHKKGMQTAWVNPATLASGSYLPLEFPVAKVEGICNWLSEWVERKETEDARPDLRAEHDYSALVPLRS